MVLSGPLFFCFIIYVKSLLFNIIKSYNYDIIMIVGDKMKVIISAGGTGGHIYPALAIANKIKEKDKNSEILYIGTSNRMEKDIVPKAGYKFIGINVDGFHRKISLKNIRSAFLFLNGINKCKKIIKKFKPDIVIGVGGYVSAPVVYSAHKLGVKCCIHEQNSSFGITNKFASSFVDKIFVSFKSTINKVEDSSKVIYTGNPCGENAILSNSANKEDYGLTPSKKLVLIVMGSLGSKTISEKMMRILTLFNNKDYEVMYVTGKNYYESFKKKKYTNNIKIVPYIDNMVCLLKKTDVLVTRAGASTLSEISSLNIPSILIPSPYVTENHQFKNAMDLVSSDAALMLEEKDLEGDELLRLVEKLLNDKLYVNRLKKNLKAFEAINGASIIYEEIVKLLGENKDERNN